MSELPQKILYIEDNRDNQRLVQRILDARGFQVHIAEDGLEGLAMARELLPVLILVDLGINGLDGYETTTRLRGMAHLDEVPIIALTADASPGARERALVAGCDGYLVKPIDPRQLPAQVGEYIGGRRDKVTAPALENNLLRAYSQKLVERLEQRVLELTAANAELQELDQLKGKFLATLSHELRTPLTALMGYLELFDRGVLGDLSEVQREAVTVMRRSGATLAQQLNSLLYFQELRGRSVNLRTLRPLETLRPLLATLYERAKSEGLTLEVVSGDALPLMADAEAFEQLVGALLDNALKFSGPNGHVRLTLQDEPSRLILRIEDNGIGIDKAHLQKIFLPFYRVETRHAFIKPGAGLGLAIARHVAESHGGQITVRSVPGTGSLFTVVLPRIVMP